MSINSINNLPSLKIPRLFDSPVNPKKTPNHLKFTTESSMEETNKSASQKSDIEKKKKTQRTSENWYG
jgi:hypothetical protein